VTVVVLTRLLVTCAETWCAQNITSRRTAVLLRLAMASSQPFLALPTRQPEALHSCCGINCGKLALKISGFYLR
jgi:hypothetical protein